MPCKLIAVPLLLVLALLPGCTGHSYAPVSERSLEAGYRYQGGNRSSSSGGTYSVQPGDTLYSIAWRYGKDFRAMARANGIGGDYRIYPGQLLQLAEAPVAVAASGAGVSNSSPSTTSKPAAKHAPATHAATPARVEAPAPAKSSAQPAFTVVRRQGAPSPAATPSKAPTAAPPQRDPADAKVIWHWPAAGKVVRGFQSRGKVNNGLDIAGHKGAPVLAAAKGRVVYAGNGLLGYGNLIIINHNEQYLSAYAHNSRLLVKENQQVDAGFKIAEIGNSGATRTMLHFEIRRDGKPVNPLLYLPRR